MASIGKIRTEWREDPTFPFKHHLYGFEELPGNGTQERLLATYWLARGKWEWHVFTEKKGYTAISEVGICDSQEEAQRAICGYLGTDLTSVQG